MWTEEQLNEKLTEPSPQLVQDITGKRRHSGAGSGRKNGPYLMRPGKAGDPGRGRR